MGIPAHIEREAWYYISVERRGTLKTEAGKARQKGKTMDGYDMMCNLVDYLAEWAVLDALSKYLPNDELVEAMESIARDYDYSFDGE